MRTHGPDQPSTRCNHGGAYEQRGPRMGGAMCLEKYGEAGERLAVGDHFGGHPREAMAQGGGVVLCPLLDVQHLPGGAVQA